MTVKNLDTALLHDGFRCDPTTGAMAVPIYQTAAYQFKDTEHAGNLFALRDVGFVYSRLGNPTVDVFEKRLASLEGGVDALAVSSGQSAVTIAICNIARQGDNIVASPAIYGGIYSLFANVLSQFGIEVRFADPDNAADWHTKTDENTRLYYGETYPNPRFKTLPIAEIAQVAQKNKVPLIVDNTCAPVICRPFEYGANIIVHSTTKYIAGQGTVIGGCIVDNASFVWKGNTPMMNEADPTYHGLVWADINSMPSQYLLRARATLLRDLGATPSPNDAFLSLQNMETLTLRMEKHCRNADKIANFLSQHRKIKQVVHTSTAQGRHKQWAEKYLHGKSAMMGVYIKGDLQQTAHFVENLKLFYHAANLGDNKSLIIHPASTTHAQLSTDMMAKMGITENYLRVSVGIENPDDLICDITQALHHI